MTISEITKEINLVSKFYAQKEQKGPGEKTERVRLRANRRLPWSLLVQPTVSKILYFTIALALV